MPEELSATLDLDYSEAIAGADALGSAIESAMADGASGGAAAVADALSGLTAEPVEVPVEADVGTAQAEVDGLTAEPIEVPVEADTGTAASEIEGLGGSVDPIEVPVEVDDAGAADQLNQIGDSSESAAGGLRSVSGAANEASGGLAESAGGASVLAGAIGGVASRSLGTVAAVGATTFAYHELFAAGVEAATGTERLAQAAGPLASSIQHIQVGNLNTSLAKLGNQFGSTGAEMDSAAAKAFQFARAGGFSATKSAEFSQGIAALAARAVALNPALGNVADVADSMSTSFGRVLLAAKKYNLALSSSEVNTRALADTGKTATNQLTVQEKAVAAVEVATAKYGDTLAQKIAQGADLAANKQKSLIATGKEVAETLGRPIAEGAIDSLSKLQGPVEGVLHLFQELPEPIQRAAAALIALGVASKLPFIGGAITGGLDKFLVGLAGMNSLLPTVAAAALVGGAAFGTYGAATGNATEATLGFAAAGAGLGFLIGGPVGAGIGAATGALVGYTIYLGIGNRATNDLAEAQKQLNRSVTTGSVPAIEKAVAAVNKATTGSKEYADTVRLVADAQKEGAGAGQIFNNQLELQHVNTDRARALTEGFNTALNKSPAAALLTIQAYSQLGISTDLYSAKLQVATQQSTIAQQANASVAASAQPLKVTFEEAATAVGGFTERQFEVAAAGSQALDSLSKLGPAQDKFNEAVKSGDASQIEAAANARATIVAQDAYNQALLTTGSATTAATFASGTFRNELQNLANTLPAGPAKEAIQGIIDKMGALSATTATPKIQLDEGGAFGRLQAIREGIDDVLKTGGKHVDVILNNAQALDSTGQISAAIQAIQQGASKPLVLQALAQSSTLDEFKTNLQNLTGKTYNITVTADAAAARSELEGIKKAAELPGGVQIKIGGDPTGANQATDQTKVRIDSTRGEVQISGNPALAQQAANGAKVYADSQTGTITIGGNDAPAGSVLVGTITRVNTSNGTITILGNDADVQAKSGERGRIGQGHIDIDGHENFKKGDYGTIGTATISIGLTGTGALFAKGQGGMIPYGGAAAAGASFGDLSLGLVGEHGPELTVLPGGSRVIDNPRTRATLQRGLGGGGNTVQITIDARGSTEESVKQLKRLDWRDVGRQIEQGNRSRAFLNGRQ